MKCIVQMPEPMDVAPSASQTALKERSVRSDRVVQRNPRAAPRHAIRKAAAGVTIP